MSNIGERIKKIRKAKGLTQQKFADTLGLKRNTVGSYEINAGQPSDRTIQDICEKFHINEPWLRTGEGDMDRPLNRSQEISDFMGQLLQGENDDFRRRLVHALSRLSEEEWELLESVALKLAEETKKEGQDNSQPSHDP